MYLLTIALPAPVGVSLTARVRVETLGDVAPLAASAVAAAGPGAELIGVEALRPELSACGSRFVLPLS